ncbi:MAG: hypothetical protein QM736_27575 [Vicinamibacterales bacterium]
MLTLRECLTLDWQHVVKLVEPAGGDLQIRVHGITGGNWGSGRRGQGTPPHCVLRTWCRRREWTWNEHRVWLALSQVDRSLVAGGPPYPARPT